jgi:hypothetical protein
MATLQKQKLHLDICFNQNKWINHGSNFLRYFPLVVLEFALWALCVLGRYYTPWSTPPNLADWFILATGSCFFPGCLILILIFNPSPIAGMTGVCNHTRFVPLNCGLRIFYVLACLEPWSSNLSLSSSWDYRHEPLMPRWLFLFLW